ncbi:MAG: TlpA disulfide reductase family protein [Nitrospinota bacterium]|nr:TlpA disulfide reductase family protein [Nitrospinota bacterium]
MSFLPLAGRTEAANFFLKTLDGQNRSLSQDKGNIILMNFWATWCPPCIREMPAMQRAYDKFKDRGFQIIAISVDLGNSDAVRKFTESLKLNFQVLLDPENRVKQAYRVRALPTTYLIDRAGRVVAYGMGAREWDSEAAFDLIAHLLKEKG